MNEILTVKRMKNFWLLCPTQLLTHGQWWSIFWIHRWHILQHRHTTHHYWMQWHTITNVICLRGTGVKVKQGAQGQCHNNWTTDDQTTLQPAVEDYFKKCIAICNTPEYVTSM